MAMRATYVPDPAAPTAAGVLQMVVTTRGDASNGELVVYRTGRPAARTVLTATQIRGLLQQWAAAARAGRGELLVGD
jgi:hypothetical protein